MLKDAFDIEDFQVLDHQNIENSSGGGEED
jgi:hypothetical protein